MKKKCESSSNRWQFKCCVLFNILLLLAVTNTNETMTTTTVAAATATATATATVWLMHASILRSKTIKNFFHRSRVVYIICLLACLVAVYLCVLTFLLNIDYTESRECTSARARTHTRSFKFYTHKAYGQLHIYSSHSKERWCNSIYGKRPKPNLTKE